MDLMVLSYLAGVVDSDGHIGIKRRRVKAGGWTYLPIVQIRQAETPAIVLASQTFGGNTKLDPPAKPTRRPMHCWQVTHRIAVATARNLLPFLRIKRTQAELIIGFGEHMADGRLRRLSHWFVCQPGEATYTPDAAAELKGVPRASVYQAISNGTLPVIREGRRVLIPSRFWDAYEMKRGQHALPPEYAAMREDFWRRCKHLNRVGPR